MIPIGPLMSEHRLIEKMVKLLQTELATIQETGQVNTALISTGGDFFQTYADRTHHGKEEDILFRELKEKNLTPEHKKTMDRLVQDHVVARATVRALIAANDKAVHGDHEAMKEIITCLEKLVDLYPRHIRLEDKEFFYPCMTYFSKKELQDMLQEFWEFDRKMIHEKYTKIVKDLEEKKYTKKGGEPHSKE